MAVTNGGGRQSLPQGSLVYTAFEYAINHCGSGLARDEASATTPTSRLLTYQFC